MKYAAILFLVLAVSVAYADEEAEVASSGGRTAWDIISKDSELSNLALYITINNLTDVLNNPLFPMTVLAPVNLAMDVLVTTLPLGTPLAGPLLQNILEQHVTLRKLPRIMNISVGRPSLNHGNSITPLSKVAKKGMARVFSWRGGQGNVVNIKRRIQAKNAAVIVVDGVLWPKNTFPSIQAAAAFYKYTSFLDAVVNASLLDAANDFAHQKTVFAPNNTAFAAVASTLLTLPKEAITGVLKYHVSQDVVATPFPISTIHNLFTNATLNLLPPTIVVAANSTAAVVTPNIYFSGGVFQGIDAVLIPDLG